MHVQTNKNNEKLYKNSHMFKVLLSSNDFYRVALILPHENFSTTNPEVGVVLVCLELAGRVEELASAGAEALVDVEPRPEQKSVPDDAWTSSS